MTKETIKPYGMHKTLIMVECTVRDYLKSTGKKGESYNDVIKRKLRMPKQ